MEPTPEEYKSICARAELHLAKARTHVRQRWPYIASTMYGLAFTPSMRVPTMGTSPHLSCAYNPVWLLAQNEEEVAASIVHECSHVLRHYFQRVKGFDDPGLFNIASDLPINDDLKDAGWTLPQGVYYASTFGLPKGLAAEEYYDLLRKQGHGDGGGQGKEERKPTGGVGRGQCGLPKDLADELDKEMGRSPQEVERIIQRTKHEMTEHAQRKGRGTIPGHLQDLVGEAERRTRIDWKDRLRRITIDATGRIMAGGDDFSLRHPSKRSYVRRLLLPGLVDQEVLISVVIDTSGSMDEPALIKSLHESLNIMEQLGIDEVWYLEVDAAVAREPKVMTTAELRAIRSFHGRGGTDFRPAFDAAKKMMPPPDILFYFTDGMGSAHRINPIPSMTTVWCLVDPHYRRKPAKWGYSILITDDPDAPDDTDLGEPYDEDDE